MGQYDFTCEVSAELVYHDGYGDTLRVHCYWKNNGWRYNMADISGWVTCNGTEIRVADNIWGNFQNNQARYELGYHDFWLPREHSSFDVSYSARLKSASSYASGERWSGGGTHTVGALESHTVSYHMNGGSPQFGNQTKWYGSALTLDSRTPSKTGHDFLGWGTDWNSGVKYQPGNQYTADANATLIAYWRAHTYTVVYNANGGVGAPGNQTKTYGKDLVLSNTKPTRSDYNFLGWATSSTGSVAYQPGNKYTNNSAVTLYAKWELAYVRPRISNFQVSRCTSNGTINDSGTYLKYQFNWATDRSISDIQVAYKLQSAASFTWVKVPNISGTSGKVNFVTGNGSINIEQSYFGQCWVKDNNGETYSPTLSIGTISFPIDVRKGGKGVAFGKVAERDGATEIGGAIKEIWLGGIKILWYT